MKRTRPLFADDWNSSMIRHSFTRRDVLRSLLGIPAALAACRSDQGPPFPDGEIVGASDTVGHRLRGGQPVKPPEDAWQRARVVIVGGGVAGLTAAWRLLKSGFEDFVLIELERAPGGTARSGSSGVVPYPWGAHYLPVPMKENRELIALLDEMGVLEGLTDEGDPIVAEQYLCRDPEERIFYRGRWYEGLYLRAGATPDDEAQLEAFNREIDRWVAWRDARNRRAFTIPVAACSDDPDVTALDRISMAEWLDRRGWNSPRLRWVIDYSCRDDYGLTIDQTSAWAGLFYFASRVASPGDEAQSLITWPEGNGRLVAHLYNKIKLKARLGFAVSEIIPTGSDNRAGVDVVAVDYDGRSAVGFHADRVIFAAPHFLTRYIIRPYRERQPAHVAEFEYGAWMVANLFLKDRPFSRGFPLAWDNVLYESPSLGYVVATHQRGLDYGPTIFTYYYPLCDADPREARSRLLATDWKGWADVTLTDLQRAHPDIRAQVERIDVMRWGHAMIRPRPGFLWGGARSRAREPFRGIHFAHSDLSGVALFEEAFYHGIRAAEEVLAECSAC
ncbi:MAG TPA: FAD-dependent oxidoreductase [Blastocatellia bacterium]|nr:FAD-dependent oxidoreductase [Blastocatellia bacterium]